MSDPILVWPFDLAPPEYQQLSGHGGDEDWLAVLPVGCEQPWWSTTGTEFGRCDVSVHPLADGRTVLIGAHA